MELKPGYKQSEVGVIPEDWEVTYVGHEFSIQLGKMLDSEKNNGVEKYYIGNRAVQWGRVDIECIGTIKLTPLDIEKYRLKKDDLLVCEGGEVGRTAIWNNPIGECYYQKALHRLRPKYDYHVRFMYYVMQHFAAAGLFTNYVTQTSIAHLPKDKFETLPLPSPPCPEQTAIATALSDVDALLDSLDRLIAKKRDIKQAAMQQLLTGETRLPGFEGEWRLVKFSDLASLSHNRIDPSRSEPCSFCVELEHIEQRTGRLLSWSSTTPQSSLKAVFEVGDVLFGKLRAYLRKHWLADCSGVCSTEIWVLKPDQDNVIGAYLYQLVTTNWFIEAASTAYGTHMPRSDWKVVRDLELHIPSPSEQEAIAQVLTDMDAEIAALEQRRAKTRDLKQAMMQELLTGRTRLVEPQASNEQANAAWGNAKGHNWAINEAVVIATLAKHFGGEDFPLGRKRYTKLSYLLHRHVERQAEGYLKKAAGPYNPKTKYGGPEKIAKQNGYITQHKGPKGHSGFIAADNIAQAEGYFEKWYGPEVIQWLEQFRFKKNDDLEVLATVDMAVVELRAAGKSVDVAAVKDVITSHPEWEAKLDRAAFSDTNIAEAIEMSGELFSKEVEF